MPKGLYFTAVVFFFSFFSTPNRWHHWTDLNQTWTTHFHLWVLFEKFGPNVSGIYPPPHGLEGQNPFLDRLWNLDRTYLCNGTWYLHATNLVNFGPQTSEKGWRVFVYPLNFRNGRHCQLYRMDAIYNRQQANFGTCYVVAWAYSLQQQNTGRAYAGLCHASRKFSGRLRLCTGQLVDAPTRGQVNSRMPLLMVAVNRLKITNA